MQSPTQKSAVAAVGSSVFSDTGSSAAPSLGDRLSRALWRPGILGLGVIIGLLIVWEIAGRWFVDPLFFAPFSKVFVALFSLFEDSKVFDAVVLTFGELALAFVLSVVIGLLIGLSVGLNRFSHRSVFPLILMIYATPQVTILPLFVLYFGIGPASKIEFGVSHGIFPMIVTIVAGVQNLNPLFLMSRTRFPWTQNWLNRSVQGGPEHDR